MHDRGALTDEEFFGGEGAAARLSGESGLSEAAGPGGMTAGARGTARARSQDLQAAPRSTASRREDTPSL